VPTDQKVRPPRPGAATIHNQVTPEDTPDLVRVFVDEFSTHAKELNVAVAHFVE
jgi:hypothetical protein